MSRPLSKQDYQALAAFRYTLRRFLRFSEDAARAAGLTARQHQALLAIQGFPGRERVTVGELAEHLQIHHHSAVGLVNRLSARGLVARRADSPDRRQVYVRLTPRGRRLLERLTTAHREELRHLAPELRTLLDGIGAR